MRRHVEIHPLETKDVDAFQAFVAEPGLASDFEPLSRPGGVADEMGDSERDPGICALARVGGEIAGFSFGFVLPMPPEPGPARDWAFVWIGVDERFRRQGIGSALLERARDSLAGRGGERAIAEMVVSGWLPNAAADAFARRHGFELARTYWMMDRPPEGVAPPDWPEGIALRTWDGTDRALQDLTDIYNDSFADHYHFVPGDLDSSRNVVTSDLFRPDGLGLAYRGEDCVGFCRSWLWPGRGEIAMLGTSRRARGIGLGRALLRWGVRWLEAQGAPRITLMVDGENESALRLYRQEGFEVARTRRMWRLALSP